ncbi:MAG TPA: hypothetical protein VM165_01435 [Planctomycetaceae bacterium]|nr:hypothetical protein [Planctomycetaceae bacterium]
MTLTSEQAAAVKDGEPIRVTPPEVGADCVLVRADVYDRVRSLVETGGDFQPRETYPAVLKALDQIDESPEQYLEYLSQAHA